MPINWIRIWSDKSPSYGHIYIANIAQSLANWLRFLEWIAVSYSRCHKIMPIILYKLLFTSSDRFEVTHQWLQRNIFGKSDKHMASQSTSRYSLDPVSGPNWAEWPKSVLEWDRKHRIKHARSYITMFRTLRVSFYFYIESQIKCTIAPSLKNFTSSTRFISSQMTTVSLSYWRMHSLFW
jgi:hypothetical protein